MKLHIYVVYNFEGNISPQEKDFLKSLGSFIKVERKKLKLSQHDLAHNAKVGYNVVGRIERAEIVTSIITLKRIMEVLGVDYIEINKLTKEY